MRRLMRTYVSPDAYIRVGLRVYMCRLMPPYVVWRVQKDLEVFKKARYVS